MTRLLNLLSIIRPHNIAAALMAVAAGYYMNAGEGFPGALLAAVALTTAAGNVINDYFDFDIDRINKPGRPIPSGSISRRKALYLYLALLAGLAAVIPTLEPVQYLWISGWVVILHLYSMVFKRRFVIGNILVSLVTGTGFLLGAHSSGDIETGLIPAVFTFFFIFAREIVKDCEDMEGDFFCGSTTIAVVRGREASMKIASALFILLAMAFPVPYLSGAYNISYLVIILVFIFPILLISALLAFSGKRPGLISILLKLGIFAGIIAFYFAV